MPLTHRSVSRRTLLTASGLAVAAAAQTPAPAEAPPKVELALVSDFVIKAHKPGVDALKAMLDQEPGLLNSAWDWGRGDWETALGGASHVGQRATAMFLLDRGARPDLFAATMLGELPTVKGWLAFAPQAHHVPGPHGIPLLSHAVAGMKPAMPVFELLMQRGANVSAAANNGLTPLMMAAMTGHADALQALLAAGADARARAKDGRTAFSIARKSGRDQVVKMLADSGISE
ncbi:MAG: ankyrin repeat domain-containing protein [Bryobacteraceae bacterium]